MARAKLKKITLIISRSDVANVLRELILLGCVEVSEPAELREDEELADFFKREDADIESCRADFDVITAGIEILEKYVPFVDKKTKTRQRYTFDDLLYEFDTESCLRLSKTLGALDEMMPTLQAEEKEDMLAKVYAASEMREALHLSYDHFTVRLALAQAVDRLLGTDYTVVLTGWVLSSYESELVDRLSSYVCAWDIRKPFDDEYDSIPALSGGGGLFSKHSREDEKLFTPLAIDTKYIDVIGD